MEYIREKDYDYIMNKYHRQDEPFDSFNRFVRNDGIFSSETGMDPEEIMKGIVEGDKEMENLPHPIRKAKALAYVLKNTRRSCDNRDVFPAINMIDRPLYSTLVLPMKGSILRTFCYELLYFYYILQTLVGFLVLKSTKKA